MTTTEVTADQARQALVALRTEIGKAVVGQDTAVTALVPVWAWRVSQPS